MPSTEALISWVAIQKIELDNIGLILVNMTKMPAPTKFSAVAMPEFIVISGSHR